MGLALRWAPDGRRADGAAPRASADGRIEPPPTEPNPPPSPPLPRLSRGPAAERRRRPPAPPPSGIGWLGNGRASSLSCTLVPVNAGRGEFCPARLSLSQAANPAGSLPLNRPSVRCC